MVFGFVSCIYICMSTVIFSRFNFSLAHFCNFQFQVFLLKVTVLYFTQESVSKIHEKIHEFDAKILCLVTLQIISKFVTSELQETHFSWISLTHVATIMTIYCVCMKHKMLGNCLCSFCDSASLVQNIEEFGAKKYFRDHLTGNTIHEFKDLVLILKTEGCY